MAKMKLILACIILLITPLVVASSSGEIITNNLSSTNASPTSRIMRQRQSIATKYSRLGKLELPNLLRIRPVRLNIPVSRVSDITFNNNESWKKTVSNHNPLHSLFARGGGGSIATAKPKATMTSSSTTTTTMTSTRAKKKRRNNTGFYYGISDDVFFSPYEKANAGSSGGDDSNKKEAEKQTINNNDNNDELSTSMALADIMGETLLELREMREDISGLREEMQDMKDELKKSLELRPHPSISHEEAGGIGGETEGDALRENESQGIGIVSSFVGKRKRQREFEAVGADVEKWAYELLFEQDGEEHGWREVKCNKAVKKRFNKDEDTTCFIKWMKDSRGDNAVLNDEKEYPCLKCFSTVNAPLEHVCAYLSDKRYYLEYNDLLVDERELEDISTNSKICWAQSPQILFIKSRDFVTYCQYRWKRDGTQVLVNQAWEHDDALGVQEEVEGKICRATALRGANFISRDPNDPNKTRFALLAHANPGGGIPQWAMKTAVSALLPIEPFKLFYKIDTRVNALGDSLKEQLESLPSQSSRPAGLSQMGYACFWPTGGSDHKGEVGGHSRESIEIKRDTVETAGDESSNEKCLAQ